MAQSSFPSFPLSDFTALHQLIQSTLQSTRLIVHQLEDLPDHLHRIRLVRLSNDLHLVFKIAPPASTPLLRHERQSLETENFMLSFLAPSSLPVPKVLRYDARGKVFGSPFLLTTRLDGISLAKANPYMTRSDRAGIDHQLRVLMITIGQFTSSAFGPVSLVSSNQGHKTWREAFISMLESVLRDAEDMLVSLPYSQIREQATRVGKALNEVKEARLVVFGLGELDNVLLDRRTKEIVGLLDFGRAIWGDQDMWDAKCPPGPRVLL
ncbi:hypothetical protein MMC12_002988 [Toensbergia leucococca]|nr:hypothetical protein [Toensbergia leucococca]